MKQIVKISKKNKAQIMVTCDKSACENCKGNFFCGSKKSEFEVNNPEELKVKVGDKVKGWQQIAEVGTTGYSTDPHLHYQVSLNGSYIDGMSLIDFTNEDSKTPLEEHSFGN